jgi:hypothetical protein
VTILNLFGGLCCVGFINFIYNILEKSGIHMKLARLIKHVYDNVPIQNGVKQGDALSPLLFNFIS